MLIAVILIQVGITYLQRISMLTNTENQQIFLKLYINDPIGILIDTVILGTHYRGITI